MVTSGRDGNSKPRNGSNSSSLACLLPGRTAAASPHKKAASSVGERRCKTARAGCSLLPDRGGRLAGPSGRRQFGGRARLPGRGGGSHRRFRRARRNSGEDDGAKGEAENGSFFHENLGWVTGGTLFANKVRSEVLPRRTGQGTYPAQGFSETRQVQRMTGWSGYLWPLVLVVVVSVVSVLVTVAGAARRTMTLLTTGWPFSVV